MSSAVEVRNVLQRYGSVTALRDLSLTVPVGQVTALLGPNGAGKTTLVDLCTGFRKPDLGTVRVLGRDPLTMTVAQRCRIGVMLQEGGVWSTARPRETVRHLASLYVQPNDPDALLTRLDLDAVANTPFRRLSGGEKQRTKLACALIGSPEVLFLDEPTAGLDPRARHTVWDLIAEQREFGRTVILSTHLMDEAEQLADHVAILHHGELVAEGAATDLTAGPDEEELRLTGTAGLNTDPLLAALPTGFTVAEVVSGQYRIRGVIEPTVLATVTSWWVGRGGKASDLQVHRRSLEDVYLKLTDTGSAPR